MKGLIIKDLMCLKKQLVLFAFLVAGVLAVSIMYVLSARFGNIALAAEKMIADNQLPGPDVQKLGSLALVLFMLLPIAMVGDMANVFDADGKAGFARVAGTLPVSLRKRVLSRYLTIFALFGIGVVVDIVIAAVLAALTDMITFADFFGIILSAASIQSIYSALAIMFCILLGKNHLDLARFLAILTLFAGVILANLGKIIAVVKKIAASSSAYNPEASGDISFLWDIRDFLIEKWYILLILAAAVCVSSYFLSCIAAEKKRGVI